MSTSSLTDHVAALWRLQSRYADVVTRRAWAELHDLFLPDTTVHIDTVTAPPRELVGPDQFTSVIGAAIERFDHFTFVILNTVVDVDEESLTATGTRRLRASTVTDPRRPHDAPRRAPPDPMPQC